MELKKSECVLVSSKTLERGIFSNISKKCIEMRMQKLLSGEDILFNNHHTIFKTKILKLL